MFGLNKSTAGQKKTGDDAAAKLDQQVGRDLVIHKMPKDYKSGNFSYAEYFNKGGQGNTGTAAVINKPDFSKSDTKRTGMVIIAIGAIVVIALGYGVYAYLKNPSAFNSFAKNTSPAAVTPVTPGKTTATNASGTPAGQNTPVINLVPTTTASATPENVAPTSTPVVNAPVTSSPAIIIDSDADGLNNVEEALLGTNPNKADTDGDGYSDLSEALNGYSPTGAGKLETDTSIARYVNGIYKYSFLYPKGLKLETSDDNASAILTADDGSFIQVVAQANTGKQDIKSWYVAQFNVQPTAAEMTKVGGVDAVQSTDGTVVYLTDKINIYALSYTPISDQSLMYKEIFEILLKSFSLSK